MYEVIPMLNTIERAEILTKIVKQTCTFDTAFSNFQSVCEEDCFNTKEISDLCETCKMRAAVVSLAFASGLTWEVWSTEGEVVGVIRLSDIKPGQSAKGHYLFFDHNLSSKTSVIQAVIEWAFTDGEEWKALQRLTIEIPDFAFALAKHASKKLGFGGPFEYSLKGKKIPVEGVLRNAVLWRGHQRDMLTLGLLNPNTSSEQPTLLPD